VLWSEWNDKYRDAIRGFWKGDEGRARDTALRLAGSPDLYRGGRGSRASINFVTAHDGFTLADLVSYNQKYNLANGEENRDGENNNLAWNGGVEGPTADPAILALRARQRRNLLATLLFSRGVPMLLGGDELSRTQRGNNNAYCQDNELSWLDWEIDDEARDFLELTRRLIRLRREQPALRTGSAQALTWLRPSGEVMVEQDWQRPSLRAFGVVLSGADPGGATGRSPHPSEPDSGDTLLLFNANAEPVAFTLPNAVGVAGQSPARPWEPLLDTAYPVGAVREPPLHVGATYTLEGRSLALLRPRAGV
jgi:isoamylase